MRSPPLRTPPDSTALARAIARVIALAVLAAALGCASARGGGGGAGDTRAGGPAGAVERHRFEVPGQGALEVAVPAGWKVAAAPLLGPGSPPLVRLEPPGSRVEIVLGAYENPEPAAEAPPAEAARTFALLARRKALGAEGELAAPLERLEGENQGFWFVAVAPEGPPPAAPGEPAGARPYRNLLRGAAAVGRLLVTFTLLDDAPGPEREALLALVRSAREVAPGEAAADGAASGAGAPSAPGGLRLEPDPGASTEPLAVSPPDVPFTVLVDLPGFSMFRPRPVDGGAGLLVLGQDAEGGLVASVTVTPAGGASDARACREAVLARLRTAAPGGPAELALGEAGGAARATYLLAEGPEAAVRARHGHAFFARDGACVDVHVSVAAPDSAAAERVEGILGSIRFGERL